MFNRISLFIIALVFSVPGFAQVEAVKEYFEKELTPRQVFEFTRIGTLGKIEKHGITFLNEQSIQKLNDIKLKNEATLSTENYYTEFPTPKNFKSIYQSFPSWKINRPFFRQFEDLIISLHIHGHEVASTTEVMNVAEEYLNNLKNQNLIGGLYFSHHLIDEASFGRNIRTVIEIPQSAQNMIDKIFSTPLSENTLNFSRLESKELKLGNMTASEYEELKKLRRAAQVFLQNSPYSGLPGGEQTNQLSPGNLPEHCSVLARCGEQSRTMLEFTKKLEFEGKIKNFTVLNQVVHEYPKDNHAAIRLLNNRTQEVFVLDSWLLSGQSEPVIQPFLNWAADEYKVNVINPIQCDTLLSGNI